MKKVKKLTLVLILGILTAGVMLLFSSTILSATQTPRLISYTPTGTLTQDDVESLKKMIQEEKLARDVYKTLYEVYKLPIFNNIARSEQNHMDAVKTLLDKYGIENPLKTDEIGKFAYPEFENLYKQLVSEGMRSLTDALNVGVKIEKLDIKDLEEEISKTNNEDIKIVYGNLRKGSENHLRAFSK